MKRLYRLICHCEERSDEAISKFELLVRLHIKIEIASRRALAMTYLREMLYFPHQRRSMYIHKLYRQENREKILEFLRQNEFATLVTYDGEKPVAGHLL